VGNLQELVYKQGQAGVTKASVSSRVAERPGTCNAYLQVTILFNNSDASQSPVGYEQHRQITVTRQVIIGGRNKYMINGHTAQVRFHEYRFSTCHTHTLGATSSEPVSECAAQCEQSPLLDHARFFTFSISNI
jgi:hypothetical protein